MQPKLSRSYRGFYPFKLSVPSFVYPASWADNVRALGPFVDEIELLMLESGRESLPSKTEIHELAVLADTFELTFNVHLPTDIFPGHSNPSIRRRAADTLQHVLDLVGPLSPSTCTLHLTPSAGLQTAAQIALWRDRLREDLEQIFSNGFLPEQISVENLFYPFGWSEPVIAGLGLFVCMDVGHLMVSGMDAGQFFEEWRHRISIMHLHGVKGNQDHLGLDRLNPVQMETVLKMLTRYRGTVSIEVFSFTGLSLSLAALEKNWNMLTNRN